MGLFSRKTKKPEQTYDPSVRKPVIRCSICTGEQVAGFRRLDTGAFEEVMLLKNADDLWKFKENYGIEEEVERFY
jgi:hypothetical protein